MALSSIEPELRAIEVYIVAIGISTFLLLWPWPWPDDLHIRTWYELPEDIPDVQIWTSYVKAFESYRLTYIHTDRQTDRIYRYYKVKKSLEMIAASRTKLKPVQSEVVCVSHVTLL